MNLSDASFVYVGEEEILGRVEQGAMTSNGDDGGDAKVSLLWWDDGYETVDDGKGKVRVLSRPARWRLYDTLTECKIDRNDDGSLRLSGISSNALAHPAYGPTEGRVDVQVTPGPDCRGCGNA